MKKKNSSTPFDDTFKTLLIRSPMLMAPVVNEVFGMDYDMHSEDVIQTRSEHQTADGKRYDDSRILLNSDRFHLECQSTPDYTISLRLIEYDFADALEEAYGKGKQKDTYELDFANSCVLQLRGNQTRLRYETVNLKAPVIKGCPGFPAQRLTNEILQIKIPVVYVQTYDLDEILEKKLFFFVPFYMMRYEEQIRELSKQDPSERSLCRQSLLENMDQDLQKLESSMYDFFIHTDFSYCYSLLNDLIRRILEAIIPPEEGDLRNEVRNIMGGHELVTPTTILLDRVQQERENAARERQNAERERHLKEQEQENVARERQLKEQEQENAARERLLKEQEQENTARERLLKEQALNELERWKNLALSLQERVTGI